MPLLGTILEGNKCMDRLLTVPSQESCISDADISFYSERGYHRASQNTKAGLTVVPLSMYFLVKICNNYSTVSTITSGTTVRTGMNSQGSTLYIFIFELI